MIAAAKPVVTLEEVQRAARERAAIDASTRLPVLTFFAAGVFWLLVGTILAIIASIKLHAPEFLADWSWLTFGRVRPAHLDAVVFGWLFNTCFGTLVWLMARLSRVELRSPAMLLVGAALWNLGTAIGVIAVLAGYSTSIEWLEFPRWVQPILVAGYVPIALWTMLMFRDRREKHVYVTQWYIIGAIFWLPWLYLVATTLLFWFPVSGVTHASILWWFSHNAIGLFFSTIGIGAIYYLIPKVIGRPVHSYYLGLIGFWSFAIFYNWAGTHHLIGGPLPAWLITIGVIGSMMMFIPVGATAINHHLTMVGHFGKLRTSPTLRFTVFGAMIYTASSFQGSLEALREVNRVTHFTHFTVGHAHLGLYGFFTMVMFGAFYYIVPRLTGWEWYSSRLIRLHFWSTALGILLMFAALTIGGWIQGMDLAYPGPDGKPVPFMQIVAEMKKYLHLRSISGVMILVGHIAFAALFVLNVMRYGQRRVGPTLLAPESVDEQAPAVVS